VTHLACLNIIGTSFKPNNCKSAVDRSKHLIYRADIKAYARI